MNDVKDMWYPTIEIFYKGKKLYLPDVYLITKISYADFVIVSDSKNNQKSSFANFRNNYINNLSIKDLEISFSCDLHYFDMYNPEKTFDISKYIYSMNESQIERFK